MNNKIKAPWMVLLGCSLLSTSMLSQAEWVEWILQPTVEFRSQSNINLSAFAPDEENDRALRLDLEGGRYFQMGDRSRLRLSAELEGESYDEFDLLNNIAISGKAAIIHKLGVGWNAGWISPYVEFGYNDVKDDIRSGNFGELGFAAGKRLSERFDMSASLEFSKSNGKQGVQIVPPISSDVFDQERWIAAIQGNFLLTNRLILLGAVRHYEGDFVSACTKGNVGTVLAVEDVKAITSDAVFGGCVYRLDGSGNSASLDLSYATGRHSSINISAEYLSGKADVLEYHSSIFRASYMYSY
jgi:hypothetical protein